MAIYGYTKNYKLIKPQFNTDTWHDYIYDNLDTIDAVMSAIYASGNWKGFWAKNTTYSADDVVIDQSTDTMYKVMVGHVTSAGTFAEEWTAHPDYYELWSPNDLAESWATKTDGKVANTDYSAKAYAISSGLIDDGSAKEWAIGSGAIGNTNEYSAKKYAADAHNDYISLTTNANIVAVGSNIANVNTVGQSISNVNTVAGNVSSVNTVATNISDVNTAATNIEAIQAAPTAASNAANSANNSHIWAEGTDAQVQALGGVHSSKVWAEQSTNANISLTNSPYTTNRILEIPQDIKLELNNGTLTLKDGSKVYLPNGFEADGTTPKFDVLEITEDKMLGTVGSSSVSTFLVYNYTDSVLALSNVSTTLSGETVPSSFSGVFYNNTTNTINAYSSGTSDNKKYSLPVCLYTRTNGVPTSIDQVFNGFGYIGSTLFLLPGVKTVVPDGRNENGTCKNKAPSTVSSVKTETISGAVSVYMFTNQVSSVIAIHHYICSKTKPTVTETTLWYNPETNLPSQVLSDGTVMTPYSEIPLAKFTSDSTGRITSFEPFTVDSVINSNEFYQLKDKAVTTDTAQTISGSKRFTQPAEGMSIELIADTDQQTVPAANTIRQLGLYRNSTHTKGDGYTAWLQGYRGTDGTTMGGIFVQRFLEGDNQTILNYVQSQILADGTPITYTKTPPAFCTGEEITTAGWFNSKMQVVSALPANPDPNVFYFIPE